MHAAAGALDAAHYDQQQQQQDGVEEPDQALASVAGGAAAVDADDEASVCSSLFRGLVFYLGREVPREALLLVLRAFGGVVGWEGEGSPLAERDDAITHQVHCACAKSCVCRRSAGLEVPVLLVMLPTL